MSMLGCAAPALVAALAFGTGPSGPLAAPTRDGEGDAAARLASIPAGTDPEELAELARSLARAPGAAALVLDVESTGAVPAGEGRPAAPPTPVQLEALELALPLLAPDDVATAVERGTAEHADPPWRRAAIELLGLHGDADRLALLVAVTLDRGSAPPVDTSLLDAFRDALEGVLDRDPRTVARLTILPPAPVPVRRIVARALGRSGDVEAWPWLIALLDEPELVPTALQEVARMAPRVAGTRAGDDAARRVRSFLGAPDSRLRKHAARALAELGDVDSVAGLITLLHRGDPGERSAAHGALRKLSGRSLPERADVWLGWYVEELRWLRDDAPAWREGLDSEDDAAVAAAARALSEHPLHRRLAVPALTPLLDAHGSPGVRAQVALALGRLGGRSALPALVAALGDDEEAVRGAACRALRSLTGLSLPADPMEWRAALREGG